VSGPFGTFWQLQQGDCLTKPAAFESSMMGTLLQFWVSEGWQGLPSAACTAVCVATLRVAAYCLQSTLLLLDQRPCLLSLF
jgi:hypothetical protein